ncbi:MAG: Rrf2 family transcriptional regulator [Rhodocyclaceae bacterium]|nr:Rrf2 family transcriptional regulator [Rhodocyclaceae bacterium]
MKLNTKSRMAIAAILDVAMHGTEKPVALAGVSERQDISLSYLEQLFRMLREQGFVMSSRGPGGGYRLNKQLSAISVADIVNAVDKKSDYAGAPHSADNCQVGSSCHAHSLWCRVDEHLQDFLRTVTLASVLEEAKSEAPAMDAPGVPAFAGDVPRRHEEVQSPALA